MLKHKKKVIIRDKNLQKVRNNLRQILILSVYDEIEILDHFRNLYGAWLDLTSEEQKEVAFLQGTKHELFSVLSNSICVCAICTKEDRDMVFIPSHKAWYCIECQEKDLIWDPSKGSAEDRRQHDYINWYREQKEKFAKNYQIKRERIPYNS